MTHKIRHVLFRYFMKIEGSEEESSYMEGCHIFG